MKVEFWFCSFTGTNPSTSGPPKPQITRKRDQLLYAQSQQIDQLLDIWDKTPDKHLSDEDDLDQDLLEFMEEMEKETKVGPKINDQLAKLVNNP